MLQVLLDHSSLLSRALVMTLYLSAGGGLLAAVLGVTAGVARLSPIPYFQRAGAAYVQIVRNTPLTVVFFVIVFVLPQVGITFTNYSLAAVIALGLYTGAFVSEAVRAGVNAVGRGQAEAARALGLSFFENMRFIIVPQALRSVVPPLANVWIALVKNTSVAAGFGVLELTASGQRINFVDPGSVLAALLWIGVIYLTVNLLSALGFRLLEDRLAVAR